MAVRSIGAALAVLLWGAVAAAQDPAPIPGIRAVLKPMSYHVPIGQPVWVQFTIENTTKDPITLTVPGAEPDLPSPEVGLPLSHVFSGGSTSGVMVTTPSGRQWERPVGYRAPRKAPILLIAPHSTVGLTVDLLDYFPALRGAGEFRLVWRPYAAGASSDSILLTIAPRKQVEIGTDEGRMTLELFYDDAPNTVTNFLELARTGFYTGLLFHRIEPGHLIQGGGPRGDGTGIRADGKRIAAEFNSRPHQKGSVSMALLEDDPDSASCQFFICNTRQKDWDGRYTVFAQLVGEESYETLERLMAIPVDEFGRPLRPVPMRTVRVLDAPFTANPNP